MRKVCRQQATVRMSTDVLSTRNKDHKSAICVIPPRTLWDGVQSIRCFNDPGFVRWPPHVNLLYPFWEDLGEDMEVAARRAAAALKQTAPFQVTLAKFDVFEHGRSCTLWLDPASPELVTLQETLAKEFPECNDLSNDPDRGITTFVPHLSVGRWRDRQEVQAAAEAYQTSFQPITFQVDQIALISRDDFGSPFTIRYSVPLGEGACHKQIPPPARVDLGYLPLLVPGLVATQPAHPPLLLRLMTVKSWNLPPSVIHMPPSGPGSLRVRMMASGTLHMVQILQRRSCLEHGACTLWSPSQRG